MQMFGGAVAPLCFLAQDEGAGFIGGKGGAIATADFCDFGVLGRLPPLRGFACRDGGLAAS